MFMHNLNKRECDFYGSLFPWNKKNKKSELWRCFGFPVSRCRSRKGISLCKRKQMQTNVYLCSNNYWLKTICCVPLFTYTVCTIKALTLKTQHTIIAIAHYSAMRSKAVCLPIPTHTHKPGSYTSATISPCHSATRWPSKNLQ